MNSAADQRECAWCHEDTDEDLGWFNEWLHPTCFDLLNDSTTAVAS